MGCFPFSFRLQARFEREIELRAQALYTLHEPPTAGSAEPTHALSNLPRLGAAQLTATPSTIPLQRSNSTDLLKFDSDLLTWQNTGPPAQREDRLQAARQLRNAKRMRETSVTLEYLDLNDLPECLAAMGNLIELQVRHSNLGRLQSLPPNLQNLRIVGAGLTHLPALPESLLKIALPNNRLNSLPKLPDRLQILSLNHNHFTELSALPVSLRELAVSGNQLTELPALPTGLQMLIAAHNQLSTLPEIPATTFFVEAHHNRLTDLPASVYEMDHLGWVDVQANPLPHAVLQRVRAGIARRIDNAVMYLDSETEPDGFRRCDGAFGASSPEAVVEMPTPPLVAAVLAWHDRMPGLENTRNQRRTDWEAADHSGPGSSVGDPSMSFATFLNRLCETAEYRDPRLQPELVARVCRLLDRLIGNATLRTHCYALATDALGECQDRIAAGLDHMEVCALSAEASDGILGESQIRALGMGMLKLNELQTICGELIESYPGIDAIELHLALRIRFASLLDLPVATQRMHYDPPPEITERHWTAAYDRVYAAASDPEREVTFLAQWKPWQAHLERRAPPQLKAAHEEKSQQEQRLRAELDAVMDQLTESPSDIFSDAYFDRHAEIARLNLEFTQIEAELIDPVRLELTRRLLAAEAQLLPSAATKSTPTAT